MKFVGPPHLTMYVRAAVEADDALTIRREASMDGTHWVDVEDMLEADAAYLREQARRMAQQKPQPGGNL